MWTAGACAAAAGATEPPRIDPAAASARIAGMTMVRTARMIPPWHLPRSAACCMAPSARTAHLGRPRKLPGSAISYTQGNTSPTLFTNIKIGSKFCILFCRAIFVLSYGEMSMSWCSARFSAICIAQPGDTMMTYCQKMPRHGELTPGNALLVPQMSW